MSNQANHLNTLHLDRPAVALFRKPLATNDEMNNELRNLLGEFVNIKTKTKTSISTSVNGNIKAVFYNPFTHISIPIHYDENLMFYLYEGKYLGYAIEVPTNEDKGYGYCLRPDFINNLSSEYKTINLTTVAPRGTAPGIYTYSELEEGVQWYILVYDNDYEVPIIKKDESMYTGGTSYSTLNLDIVESSEKLNVQEEINKSWFLDIKTEKDKNKSITTSLTEPLSIYKIKVKKDTYLALYTLDRFNTEGFSFRNLKSYRVYQQNKVLIQNLIDNYNKYKTKIESVEGTTFSCFVSVLHKYLTGKGGNVFSDISKNYKSKNNPDLSFNDFSCNSTYKQINYTPIFKRGTSTINFIEAYITLAVQLNDALFAKNRAMSSLGNSGTINRGLYEFPLKEKNYESSGYDTKSKKILTVRQFESALSSFSSKDITPSRQTNENSNNYYVRSAESIQKAVPNPKLIDFKLLYYLCIEYNVVVAKYKKLENDFIDASNPNSIKGIDFSKQSLVKMVPSDFFSITSESVEEGSYGTYKKIAEFNNISTRQIIDTWYDQIKSWDNETKEKLCKRYEDIYYGNWSGFYYSNTTTQEETVAGYTNTTVPLKINSGTIISNAVSEFITPDKTSKDLFYSSLNSLNVNDISNRDITSITISREMNGESSATVVINAINEKYSYKTGLSKGQSLFEPYDEVLLFLPNTNGSISLSFKGYITTVQRVNNQGYHNIALQCSCPLTLLKRIRTNIKPSFDLNEALGSYPTPFSVREDLYKSVEHWIPFMCMQGLSYFTSMLHPFTKEDLSEDLYVISIDQKNTLVSMPYFSDDLLNYLWFRDSNNAIDQKEASYFLNELIQDYTTTSEYLNGKNSDTVLLTKGITSVATMLANNNSSNKDNYTKLEYTVYAQRDSEDATVVRTEVARITGTLQPAFALGTSDIPLVFSDYRPNIDILKETAEKFNFAFYSRQDGIVIFEPINTSLRTLNYYLSKKTNNYAVYKDSSDILNYCYDCPNVLSYQNTIRFEDKEETDKIVNWIQISGSYKESEGLKGETTGSATTLVDVPSIKRYGVHAQKQQAILGVSNMDALKVYGSALIDRQNRFFRTASSTTIGSGNINLNCPVYSALNNTIYIRTGLVLNYKAGSTFTADHVLHWGKKPLFSTTDNSKWNPEDLIKKEKQLEQESENYPNLPFIKGTVKAVKNSLLDSVWGLTPYDANIKDYFNTELSNLNKNSIINPAYYRQLSFILSNKGFEYLLPMFVFNGYVWDGLSSISFEDLSTFNATDAVLSGFQTSLYTQCAVKEGDGTKYVNVVNMKQAGIAQSKKDLSIINNNNKSLFVGLYNGGDTKNIRSVYIGTNKFSSQ